MIGLDWAWEMPSGPFDPTSPWGEHLTDPPNLPGWTIDTEGDYFPAGLRGYFWFKRLGMGAVQNVDQHLDLMLAVLDSLASTGSETVAATAARAVIGHEAYWQHYMCWLPSQGICTYQRHPLHRVRLTDEGHAIRLMLRRTSRLKPGASPRLSRLDRRDTPVLEMLREGDR